MTNKQTGWALFGVSFCSMLGLIALDMKEMQSWNEIIQIGFVAQVLAHIGTVGTAFFGGKMIPTEPMNQRETDNKENK